MSLGQESVLDGTEPMAILDEQEQTDLLYALGDPKSRAILQATSSRALTAAELSETLEIPLSTVYRRLDTLADTPFLEEDYRFASDGKHPAQYRCTVRSVCVEISEADERSSEMRMMRGSTP